MIKLKNTVPITTIEDQNTYNVLINLVDLTITEGVRTFDPQTDEYNGLIDLYNKKRTELEAIVPTASNLVSRQNKSNEIQAVLSQMDALKIKDHGVCVMVVRYRAERDGIEIRLPIEGLKESFSCFLSDLNNFPSHGLPLFEDKRKQCEYFIVQELAMSKFLGFSSESDFIVE